MEPKSSFIYGVCRTDIEPNLNFNSTQKDDEMELPTTAGKEAVGVTRAVLPGESRAERHVSYSVTVQCFNLEVK